MTALASQVYDERFTNEMQLLGALMVARDLASYREVEGIVQWDQFGDSFNGRLFGKIGEAAELGLCNFPLVKWLINDLEADATLDELKITSRALVARYVRHAAPAISIPGCARQVRHDWLADRLKTAMANEDSEQIETVAAEMDRLKKAHLQTGEGAEAIAKVADKVLQKLQDAFTLREAPKDFAWPGSVELAKTLGGWRRGRFYVIAGRPGMGKAQPLDAKIRTTTGWKSMGEVRLGDRLKSIDGHPSIVSGVFRQGAKQVYRVTFSDGRSTRCCGDHLWKVHYREWAEPRVLSTDHVVGMLKKIRYRGRLWIDHAPTAEWGGRRDVDLPLDPYVLGVLLGDGGLSQRGIRFTSASAEVLEECAARLDGDVLRKVSGAKYCYSITRSRHDLSNNTLSALHSLGLTGKRSWEKFVPRQYLDAPPYQRLQCLRGLLDTDGWVEKSGTVLFSSSSHQLALDVQELARSLGAWCSLRTKTPAYSHMGERRIGRTAYVLSIAHPKPQTLFFMSRKAIAASGRMVRKMPTFSSIVEDGTEECQCISVTHPSHLYFTDDYVVTHNTTTALSWLLKTAAKGHGVMVFSLEMGRDELTEMALCDLAWSRDSRIEYRDISASQVGALGFERKFEAVCRIRSRLDSLPFHIADRPGLTVAQIRAAAQAYAQRLAADGKRLEVICIDHLNLIAATGRYSGSKAAETEEISMSLKQLAKELDVAVISLVQLNRGVEGREDKRPGLSDLRWSGAIEQDADVVMFVYREAYYLERQKKDDMEEELARQAQLALKRNTLEVMFGKHRGGPCPVLEFYCDLGCAVIRDKERQHG